MYTSIQLQLMRKIKLNSSINTGQLQNTTLFDLQTRVNAIKTRSKIPARYSHEYQSSQSFQNHENHLKDIQDVESDAFSTNFNPKKPQIINVKKQTKSINKQKNGYKPFVRKSVQFGSLDPQKRRPMTSYKQSYRLSKGVLNETRQVKHETRALIYKQQMEELKNLYELLAQILDSIKQQDLNVVEQAISNYLNFIQSKKISFIDDFIEGRQKKLQKVIRQARLDESLSIAYLFLQMAQERIENHQSYLTNFIGYCLSNLLLTVRVYILKEVKPDFQESDFEKLIKQVQLNSFGQKLSNLDDVLLRLQHNNQIIMMMHKKLGRFNPKFQLCIQLFFKNVQRKKTSCSQCTYYIFQYLALHIHESQLVGFSKSLQIAPIPYCPPPIKNYTLIIEPLGILYSAGRYRPYMFQFLQWANKYFDIVLWTWQMPYEAEIQKIYQKIEQYLTSKLYRYHCIEQDQIYLKDLNRLGRNLDKVLIVDYDKRIYSRQPKNGIQLKWKYTNSNKDKGLLYLCQILQQMVTSESSVEDMLKIYAQQLYNIKG